MFKYASNAVINNSQYLSELDMIGDADFGVNISSGFEKILVKLTPLNDPEIGSVLELAGDIFILEIGATIGGFLGLAFQRAGRQLRGKKTLNSRDIVMMLETMLTTIKEIGGARSGDKTMIDALEPAVRAANETLKTGSSDVSIALENAAKAADAGAKSTAEMISKAGRSSYLGERSRGKIDPGAMFVSIFLNALAQYSQR